jgi:hypothetical protein
LRSPYPPPLTRGGPRNGVRSDPPGNSGVHGRALLTAQTASLGRRRWSCLAARIQVSIRVQADVCEPRNRRRQRYPARVRSREFPSFVIAGGFLSPTASPGAPRVASGCASGALAGGRLRGLARSAGGAECTCRAAPLRAEEVLRKRRSGLMFPRRTRPALPPAARGARPCAGEGGAGAWTAPQVRLSSTCRYSWRRRRSDRRSSSIRDECRRGPPDRCVSVVGGGTVEVAGRG